MSRRTTVGTRIAAVALVPLLALGWLAATTVARSMRDRQVAQRIAEHAGAVRRYADLVLALRIEHEMSIVLVGTRQYGIAPAVAAAFLGIDPLQALADARRAVDAAWVASTERSAARVQLDALRGQIDAADGRVGDRDLHDLRVVADDVRTELDRHVADLNEAAQADRASGRSVSDGANVVRALVALIGTLDGAGNAAGLALGVSTDPQGDAVVAVEGTALAAQAIAELAASTGRVGEAARALQADPALSDNADQLDGILRRAVTGQSVTVPLASLATFLDGVLDRIAAAGSLLTTAAADAEDHARADADVAAATVGRLVAAVATAVVACIAFAVVVARGTAAPLRAIEQRAHELTTGVMSVDPLPRAGPREAIAASGAIDELVRALTVVQERAGALAAGDLDAAEAPAGHGRFATSVHEAVDRLRLVMAEANRLRDGLAHAATHDALTGLHNRAALLQTVTDELARGERPTVAFIDLDGFKAANDAFGHAVGDDVLRVVADRLRAIVPGDRVARFGGDEFVYLLADADDADAEAICRRIVDALSAPIPVGVPTVRIGASIGIATAVDGDTASSLLGRADGALYEAKASGRGRVVTAAVTPSAPR